MSGDYYSYRFTCTEDQLEILTAWLSELPFDTFEDDTQSLTGYIPSEDLTEDAEKEIQSIAERSGVTYVKEFIAAQNWNEEWESNFQPVIVDDFCAIRAEFHEPIPGVKYELIITPKMSFGTGHHGTTRLMVKLMSDIDFKGKKVLDFGCGTAVLAILAAKMGATDLTGIDIHEWSCINAEENCAANGVPEIDIICDDESAFEHLGPFDVILANINKHVILESLDKLDKELSANHGELIISGFIEPDIHDLQTALEAKGLQLYAHITEGDWQAMAWRR